MRKRVKVEGRTEQVSVSMALGQIRRSDIAVLVVDAALGPSEQDQRIAGAITEAGRAIVIALNKSDLLGGGAVAGLRDKMRDEMHFLDYAPTVLVSALRGEGLGDLMAAVDSAAEQHERRVSTSEINKFFADVCEVHPPPTQRGRAVRVHYMTQGGVRPPTFLLWTNHPRYLVDSYRRFLVNQLRKRYGFAGTPLRLIVKRKRKQRRGEGA
jgi:GTP-binding protein